MADVSLDKVRDILGSEHAFNALYINGEYVAPVAGETFPTFNPATEKQLHDVPKGGVEDINKAVEAAKAANARGDWAALTAVERAKYVRKMADGLKEKCHMLAQIESADVGKTTKDAAGPIQGMVGEAYNWCDLAEELDAFQDTPVLNDPFDVVYRRDPIGVVGLITAWNYPINVAFRKICPALIAGNCAVVKPSEISGLSVMYFAQLAIDVGLPKGVLNIVIGDRDAGAALSNHPDVSMVSFTGSSATGAKVMQSCAPRLAQTMLELGGKSGLIVFDDVDVDKAVLATMKGFLTNGGQICTAHTRLIVHENIKDKLLSKLKIALEKLPFADDPIAETERGDRAWEEGTPDVVQPVVCKSQYDKISTFLDKAKASGFDALTGGSAAPNKRGYYIQPTVFVDVPSDSDIWQNEVFGPVLVVRSFRTEDEAVQEINNTKFGLASSVMCANPVKARRVANQVRAGAVYCTSTGFGILFEFPNVQRGGFGMSGVGRELGLHGLFEYTELKSINFSGFTKEEAGVVSVPTVTSKCCRPGYSTVAGGALVAAVVAIIVFRPGCPAARF